MQPEFDNGCWGGSGLSHAAFLSDPAFRETEKENVMACNNPKCVAARNLCEAAWDNIYTCIPKPFRECGAYNMRADLDAYAAAPDARHPLDALLDAIDAAWAAPAPRHGRTPAAFRNMASFLAYHGCPVWSQIAKAIADALEAHLRAKEPPMPKCGQCGSGANLVNDGPLLHGRTYTCIPCLKKATDAVRIERLRARLKPGVCVQHKDGTQGIVADSRDHCVFVLSPRASAETTTLAAWYFPDITCILVPEKKDGA